MPSYPTPFGAADPRLAPMTDDHEHLVAEVAQFLQHVHDIADLLATRMAAGVRGGGASRTGACPPRCGCQAARSKEWHSGDRVERRIRRHLRDPDASRRAAKAAVM